MNNALRRIKGGIMNLHQIFNNFIIYNIGGKKYIIRVDFLTNRLSIKYNNQIIFAETLDNYTNNEGLNMKGYIKKVLIKMEQEL